MVRWCKGRRAEGRRAQWLECTRVLVYRGWKAQVQEGTMLGGCKGKRHKGKRAQGWEGTRSSQIC